MVGYVIYVDLVILWGGKVFLFSVSYGKLMMWFFFVLDVLIFGGLFIFYGFICYIIVSVWFIGEEIFDFLFFFGYGFLLVYVVLMIFIFIVFFVIMVFVVEVGYCMDKKGVMKWMIVMIIGGFFFFGFQVWEWFYFIYGLYFGSVELFIGECVIVKGYFGDIISFMVVEVGRYYQKGEVIKGMLDEFFYEFCYVVMYGLVKDKMIIFEDGLLVIVQKYVDYNIELIVKNDGNGVVIFGYEKKIEGKKVVDEYWNVVYFGEEGCIIYGVDLKFNEYGLFQYGQFFFFIIGFYGFYVFLGVIINILIFLGVMRGIYYCCGYYEMVEKIGFYWYFVDFVWVFVFIFFYFV